MTFSEPLSVNKVTYKARPIDPSAVSYLLILQSLFKAKFYERKQRKQAAFN